MALHPQAAAGLCGRCSRREQRALEVRASPWVSAERLQELLAAVGAALPGRAGRVRVPGRARHPGRLYDVLPALPRPRATGNFQKPYIPRPPWMCEYLYLCVSVEIFRWLFPPRPRVEGPGRAGQGASPFSAALWACSLPPFAPTFVLLMRFLAESGAWRRGCEWGEP